ncbi:hypothetical protein COO60DRAFT_1706733 [Scenedesmus sp. NREL 46B-D3]|nr:hypothetical protein COO60DRAFT_1706733 [Scenedesmus sp. NREL 46B-D3]
MPGLNITARHAYAEPSMLSSLQCSMYSVVLRLGRVLHCTEAACCSRPMFPPWFCPALYMYSSVCPAPQSLFRTERFSGVSVHIVLFLYTNDFCVCTLFPPQQGLAGSSDAPAVQQAAPAPVAPSSLQEAVGASVLNNMWQLLQSQCSVSVRTPGASTGKTLPLLPTQFWLADCPCLRVCMMPLHLQTCCCHRQVQQWLVEVVKSRAAVACRCGCCVGRLQLCALSTRHIRSRVLCMLLGRCSAGQRTLRHAMPQYVRGSVGGTGCVWRAARD